MFCAKSIKEDKNWIELTYCTWLFRENHGISELEFCGLHWNSTVFNQIAFFGVPRHSAQFSANPTDGSKKILTKFRTYGIP
jgi:hypothetical protein